MKTGEWACPDCGRANSQTIRVCQGCENHWMCPSCAVVHANSPGGARCTACGWNEYVSLELTGDNGVSKFSITTKVGRILLMHISSEGNYASEYQFDLLYNNSKWMICPNVAAANPTHVNNIQALAEIELKCGDEISVGSRTDASKRALKLTVKI